MPPIASRRVVRCIPVLLLLPLAGCATVGRSQVAMAPTSRLSDGCAAFAREEAEVARRQSRGLRQVNEERFRSRAAAQLAEAESLGYVGSPPAAPPVAVDIRSITTGVAALVIAVEAVAQRIDAAIESFNHPRQAYEAAVKDCSSLDTVADDVAPSRSERARQLHQLGNRYLAQGKYDEAERFYRRALALRGTELFATHTAVAESLKHLVGLYHAGNRHADAERLQAWLGRPLATEEPSPVEVAKQPSSAP